MAFDPTPNLMTNPTKEEGVATFACGHPRTPENTKPRRVGDGQCRTCVRATARERYAKSHPSLWQLGYEAALASHTPEGREADREEVARIIDGGAFGHDEGSEWLYGDRELALTTKADAIIALLRSPRPAETEERDG